MKSFSSVLNIVLLIAVIILFYLHFKSDTPVQSTPVAATGSDLYFVNIDSLNTNLKYLAGRQEELSRRERALDKSLREKGMALEKEIIEYQKKVQSGTLTPKEMQSAEQRFAQRQQALLTERDTEAASLLNESQEINKNLMDRLRKHMDDFRKDKQVRFIFAYTEGSNILYADDAIDITHEILAKMNAEGDPATGKDSAQ